MCAWPRGCRVVIMVYFFLFLCSRIKNLRLFSTMFQNSSTVSRYYMKQLVCAAWQMLAYSNVSQLLFQKAPFCSISSLLCCSAPLVCWLHSPIWRMLLKFPFGALCGHSDQTSGMAGPWQGSLLLFCAEHAHKCTATAFHTGLHVHMYSYVHVILVCHSL